MIDAGWGVNNENPKDGKALIHLAAHSGNISLLTTLVKAGADVNLMDSRGDTPLQHILKKSAHCMGNQSGLLQCFEYLTQLPEVHCDLSDKDGFTPIHFASFKMKEQVGVNYYCRHLFFGGLRLEPLFFFKNVFVFRLRGDL